MATFYEGRRGSGKSKFAVEQMQKRLQNNRVVATNLDLFLDKLCPDNPKSYYVRLPDFPRSCDLRLLGKAYADLDYDNPDSYDESKNGLVVLDELLTSFNSRNWNDPDRLEVVNWIVQSRKDGWDLVLIGQSIDAIDKQIKETVIDELYSFRSSLNLFPGLFWKIFIKPWFDKICPKFHICKQFDGRKIDNKQRTGSVHFRRNDLHECYKTSQQFKKDIKIIPNPNGKKPIEIDLRATYTVLHPDYFKSDIKEKESIKPKSDVIDLQEEQKSKFKPLIIPFLFLIFSVFVYSSISNSPVPESKPSTPVSKSSNNLNKFKISKTKLSDSDLGLIFINCSNITSEGDFDYCFNDVKLNVVEPDRIGFKALWVNECHAKLIRGNEKYDVYCNPIKIASEKPDFGDSYLDSASDTNI